MSKVGVITLALLGFVLMSGVAHAEIFKWVDENGKVHFSDRKTSPKAQTVNVKTGAKTLGQNDGQKDGQKDGQDVDQNASNDQSPEEYLLNQKKYVNFLTSERLERQEKRQAAQQEKDKKRKLCAAMQDKLKGFTDGNIRWYELDEKTGERVFASDDQINIRKQELQSEIKSNCS
jgi:hypothetical protein